MTRNQNALTETGYMKPFEALTVDDKEEVISILIDYHCLIKPKAAYVFFGDFVRTVIANNSFWYAHVIYIQYTHVIYKTHYVIICYILPSML